MKSDDRRLISECLSGRPSSYGDLVLKYQDRLYNALVRIVDHAEDAQDIVQEAFINAYQSLGNFKGDAEFFTWLYRIAFNAAVSQRRKKRNTISLDGGRNGEILIDPIDESVGIGPGDALERVETEKELHEAMSRLSTEHRAVLVMKEIDGLKYEDIAAVMDIPIGTVRSRLHRARLELRALMESGENRGTERAITDSPVGNPESGGGGKTPQSYAE